MCWKARASISCGVTCSPFVAIVVLPLIFHIVTISAQEIKYSRDEIVCALVYGPTMRDSFEEASFVPRGEEASDAVGQVLGF